MTRVGAWTLLCLLGALACSVAATWTRDWRTLWGVISVLLVVGAIVSFQRSRRQRPDPVRVNRLRGLLTVKVEPGMSVPTHFIGSQFKLHFPNHWKMLLPQYVGTQVEVDVRVTDQSVVRLSPLSIHDEIKQHPPVYWGRHLAFSLLAALICLVAWRWSDDLLADLRQGYFWVKQAEPRLYPSVAALQEAPPAVGDWVHLKGDARCEVKRPVSMTARTCSALRWGGEPPVVPPLTLDAVAAPRLRASVEDALTVMASTQRGGVLIHRDEKTEPPRPASPTVVWNSHQDGAPFSGPKALDLIGLVTGRDDTPTGLSLSIKPRGSFDVWGSGLPVLWLAFAVGLLVVHAPRACLKMRASGTRKRAVEAWLRDRARCTDGAFGRAP